MVAATKRVPLGQLETWPGNPRAGDVDAIVESLEAHGQYRALVVQKSSMRVIAGNHTLIALRALERRDALCHLLDVDDDEARRIVLVDNRTSDIAVYDERALLDLLSELPDFDGVPDLEGTGYDEATYADLVARFEPQPDQEPGDDPPAGGDPRCQVDDVWRLGEHRLLVGDAPASSRSELDALLSLWEKRTGLQATIDPDGRDGLA